MKEWTDVTTEFLGEISEYVHEELCTETKDHATVLALHGDLGAGKTTFVQHLAKKLGVLDVVTSPTFVVMKMYQSEQKVKNFVHIDAYRIEDIDEMRVLGFESLLQQKDTIICIEWAERIKELLPSSTHHLTFSLTGKTRTISFS